MFILPRFVTSEVQASVIEFALGDDAILTADFRRIPNPFPKDLTITEVIFNPCYFLVSEDILKTF